LEDDIHQGVFREDLYFRLNEIHIIVPPLRMRENDALLLAKKFLYQVALENNRPQIKGFTVQASQLILEYPWPGNVRELRSRIKRAVVMADGNLITPENLDLMVNTTPVTLKEAREQVEFKVIGEALERNKGNVSLAAKELGVTRPTLHDLMRKYTISKRDFTL
jgi:two-component system NtrC family response regulator